MRKTRRNAAAAAHPERHVIALVVHLPITKLDALDAIAFAADGAIEGAGTAFPRVPLGPSAWAEVELPRFGEPPPFAIDVWSTASLTDAADQAERLRAALERLGWRVRISAL